MGNNNQIKVEKALLVNGDIYKNLVQSINGYFYSVQFRHCAATAIYHSPQCEIITGYTQQDYKNDPYMWLKMVHEEDKDRVVKFFNDIESLKGRRPIEHRIYHKNGSMKWVANHCTITFGDDGSVLSVNGLIMDITEKKLASEELHNAKERAEEAMALKDKFVALVGPRPARSAYHHFKPHQIVV
jgi:PAS domain S-box-containing protein